jgi:hypothetical protein
MIKETLFFLPKNSFLGFSALVLETLNLQNSSIALLLTLHKQRAQAYKQTNKREKLRTDTSNKRKALKEHTKG